VKGNREPSLILVVDDDRDNREMYRHYLEWVGFRVVEAANGLEAFERATALKPAVIVTDLALPGLDGWEAARRLKANPGTQQIPILAISAHAYGDDVARAYAAGCDLYLAKPCLPQDLVRKIRTVLKRMGATSKATRANGRRPVVAVPPSDHSDLSPGGRGKALEASGPPGVRAASRSGGRGPARLDRRSR
jgi:CheY-like chemotaxis protein